MIMHIVHGLTIGDLTYSDLVQLHDQLVNELPEELELDSPLVAELELVEEELCLRSS